jgi:hypothetical protein
MAKSQIITPGSLNLAVNPLLHKEGDMIRCLNVENDQFGAKKKRPGYTTYLGTSPNGSAIQDLSSWHNNTGTQFWNYNLAGGLLYYSTQGTGDWTICGNGTLDSGGTLTTAVNEDTLLVGDGVSATRHTTNGTSFTNTTSAPIAVDMEEYQQRIYAIGTASSKFWSNVGTPTDWTNDSSSINIPGSGKLTTLRKLSDRLITGKNSGIQHRWDGYNLFDLSTTLAPTSSRSLAKVERLDFGLNRLGVFVYNGDTPELISNAIEKQIYNDAGEGIQGTTFDNAEGIVHKYEYMLSVGTVTDDLTDEEVPDCILVYDYQSNEWWNNQFSDRPRAWLSYDDVNGDNQLVFASDNQCYTYGGTNTDDNGSTITSVMEGVIHMDTLLDKKWNWFRALFNVGCEAQVQIAISNTFTKRTKNWVTLGQALDGVAEYRFPEGSRGKFLFWKINESSRNTRMNFFGFEYDATIQPK